MNHADVRVGMPAIWLHKLTDGSIQRKSCKIIGISSQRVRILVKRWGNVPIKVSVKAQYLEVKSHEQLCIHCHQAKAVQSTLYCQPCLDALGQEWLRNYEMGLLRSTLPAFFEAVAIMAWATIEAAEVAG